MKTIDKAWTIQRIEGVLMDHDSDNATWANAAAIFDQMPITLCELGHGATFEELVAFAANDLNANG